MAKVETDQVSEIRKSLNMLGGSNSSCCGGGLVDSTLCKDTETPQLLLERSAFVRGPSLRSEWTPLTHHVFILAASLVRGSAG